MTDNNHYETLSVSPNASQAEIKQAYRRLAKQYHPDVNQETSQEEIIRINAAYEVLSNTQSRANYDRQLHSQFQKVNSRQKRTAAAQQYHRATRKKGRDADEEVEEWLRVVYQPVNRVLCGILNSLEQEIDQLAADPFDDELLEKFQTYLEACRNDLRQAQINFRSLPNPPSLARAAAHLYYCLNQIGDGLNELEYFPLNYHESYLHAGQEMFRIAHHLYYEAQESVEAH